MLKTFHNSSVGRRLVSFAEYCRNNKGVAAVEFAMILPIMLLLYVGTIETSQGYSASRRVTTVASATADLVAQTDEITKAELDDIVEIAGEIMKPYVDAVQGGLDSRLSITIASVYTDSDDNTEVRWSHSVNTTADEGAILNDMPDTLKTELSSVIVATVSYNYQSLIATSTTMSDEWSGTNSYAGITLSDTFYLRPRKSVEVVCNDCN